MWPQQPTDHHLVGVTEPVVTNQSENESVDEEYGELMHNTVVLCSADDDFTLSQVHQLCLCLIKFLCFVSTRICVWFVVALVLDQKVD